MADWRAATVLTDDERLVSEYAARARFNRGVRVEPDGYRRPSGEVSDAGG